MSNLTNRECKECHEIFQASDRQRICGVCVNERGIEKAENARRNMRWKFAAMMLQGIKANSIPGVHHRIENSVPEAVEYADALIAELERTEKKS